MQDDDYAIISVEKETTNQMESEFMFMIEFPLWSQCTSTDTLPSQSCAEEKLVIERAGMPNVRQTTNTFKTAVIH